MSNYLKKLLFSILILTMPYANFASKSMNTEDYDGPTVRSRKVSFAIEDQKNVQSFTKQSTSSQVESLEGSTTSWASYLTSPVKATMQMANEFVAIATHNSKLAMVVGFSYILPAVEAACACYCTGGAMPVYCCTRSDRVACQVTCLSWGPEYNGSICR